jgi:hypothetical protein
MVTEIYYSVQNCGDGSAYPRWFESMELAELDQDYMDEGWGESCTGSLRIEHEGPIKVLDRITTADSVITELEDNLMFADKYSYPAWKVKDMKEYLEKIKKLKEQQ